MRQVRQHARADDAVNVSPMKLNVWRMSSARTRVRASVAGGAGAWESEQVRPTYGPRTTQRGQYRCQCAYDVEWLPGKDGGYPIEQSGCVDGER